MQKKLNRTKIEDSDLNIFCKALENWSSLDTSLYFVNFYKSFGMSEAQFYKRVYLCKEKVSDFSLEQIRRNLKVNKFINEKNLHTCNEKLTKFQEVQMSENLKAMTPEELQEILKKARNEGANMLYRELINYLLGILEVFAAQFRPQDIEPKLFLGLVIQTLGKVYDDKYNKKDESSKESNSEAKESEKSS